jgi:choline dehydrogenase-like flavoprotein
MPPVTRIASFLVAFVLQITSYAKHDPATSVLDPHCKAHDLDNHNVVDASCFVSASAVNPSLTIIANAIRLPTIY